MSKRLRSKLALREKLVQELVSDQCKWPANTVSFQSLNSVESLRYDVCTSLYGSAEHIDILTLVSWKNKRLTIVVLVVWFCQIQGCNINSTRVATAVLSRFELPWVKVCFDDVGSLLLQWWIFLLLPNSHWLGENDAMTLLDCAASPPSL